MNHQLLKKSINARNIQAIKEQVNREEVGIDYMPPIPEFKPSKVVKGKAGWYSFFLQLRP
jgi:hypothetical protein